MAKKTYRIALLGFGEFERNALASYFRLAANRSTRYRLVHTLTDAGFLVADADDAPSVQLVLTLQRVADTVFIGGAAPDGALACLRRPIDALRLMRELDAVVQARHGGTPVPMMPAADSSEPVFRLEPAAAADAPVDAPEPVQPDTVSFIALREPTPLQPTAPPAAATPDFDLANLPGPKAAVIAAPPPAPAPARTVRPPPASPRALVVDDSEIARRFLQSRLRPWGLVVDCAAHSGQALELLARHGYELVFLDVELGSDSELDGLALCQRIKHSADAVNAAVVMVSAHHSGADRVRGTLAGCDAYLAKPVDMAELDRLLKRQGLKQPQPPAAN